MATGPGEQHCSPQAAGAATRLGGSCCCASAATGEGEEPSRQGDRRAFGATTEVVGGATEWPTSEGVRRWTGALAKR
jgi:hypothetical protein